jgi:hypothetical protein
LLVNPKPAAEDAIASGSVLDYGCTTTRTAQALRMDPRGGSER